MAKKTRNTSSAAYPVEPAALNQQQDRLRKAAASAAAALKGGGPPTSNALSTGTTPPGESDSRLASGPAETRFQLLRPAACQVCVAGDFNGWSPNANPLRRNADGTWETALPLGTGRYEYKFVVDGEWIADPAASDSAVNEFGSVNSIVTVS